MGAFEDIGYRLPATPPSGLPAIDRGESLASPVLRTPAMGEIGAPRACMACGRPAPARCVFCPDCHFALPPPYARAALKARIACERAEPGFRAAEARRAYDSTLKSCLAALAAKGGRPC